MRGLTVLLLAFLFVHRVDTQVAVPQDSNQPDTTLVHALIDSSFEYSFSNPDKAIGFARKAKELSELIQYRKGKAEAYGELGYSSRFIPEKTGVQLSKFWILSNAHYQVAVFTFT